jgi:plastocyanin
LGFNPILVRQVGGARFRPGRVNSSGILRVISASPRHPPAAYLLTFTKAGSYRYQCGIHSRMRGVVNVLPRAAAVSSPADVTAAAKAQLVGEIATIRQIQHTTTKGPRVILGPGASNGAVVLGMFPRRLTVKAGQTVTFQNGSDREVHTVTFGPAKLRSAIEKTFVAPTGSPPFPVFNSLGAYPSEPPGSPAPVRYDGTNHGNGYLNSGVLLPKGTPAKAGPSSFRVRFTKPGVYNYECVIHANMDGTIVVR